MKIAQYLPESVKQPLRKIRNSLKYIPYIGTGRYCSVCKKPSRRFGEYGIIPRADAACMYCGSLERHRLTWLYFERMTDLFNKLPKKMLHVAPEPIFEKLLKSHLGTGYLTADLYNQQAMVKMDITNIQYTDESFDVIYCCHVLEHVPDDKQAMREFLRVLKSDGCGPYCWFR